MTTAIALQPSMPRPTPVPITATRPRKQRPVSEKETIIQLRPVPAGGGGPAASIRTRRDRPCDACRRRKSRCVINEGAALCVLCEFHKQECTFVEDPLPRKRKLNPDARKDDHTKKRSVEIEPPVRPAPKSSISPIATRPVPLPPVARDTTVLGETLGLQRRQHSRYIGPTTPFDPLLISLSKFDHRNESAFDLGTLRRVNDHECFIMLPDEATRDFGDDREALRAIDALVSPHGPSLVDVYFRIVHPSFPIIQKQLFLERYRSGDPQISPPLLAGIYLLAVNWWSYDPNLARLPKPDVVKLEAIASRTLAATMKRPKLSTLQAGLLLLQKPDSDSWALTTQLVAIGQELGLHLDCSNWSIPLWERGLRKRIAWALYMQDKWSSLIHGRPSHIFGANWAVGPIADDDFAEDLEPAAQPAADAQERAEIEKGRHIFAQLISLTNIMAEVLDTFYTQVAIRDFEEARENSIRVILERAKPVQIKLKDWFSKLPSVTRMDHVSETGLSSTGSLHLAYFATEITLHRRIVQSLDPKASDAYLLYICRSAAKTRLISAMDFVNRLKPQHLQAFWYFASKINFTLIGTFGSLLWATAPGKEEAEFYQSRLREYRWTLSVSSRRAAFLDYAVQMLDASRVMLQNLGEKPSLAQARVSSAGVPSAQAEQASQQPERASAERPSPMLGENPSVHPAPRLSSDPHEVRMADVGQDVVPPGTPQSGM